MNKDLKFEEFNAKNSSTAYMLVYIRKTKAKEIIGGIKIEEIPPSLSREIELKRFHQKYKELRYKKVRVVDFEAMKRYVKWPGFLLAENGKYDKFPLKRFLASSTASHSLYYPDHFKAKNFINYLCNRSSMPTNRD